MNKVTGFVVAMMLGMVLLSTTVSADVKKGQKIFLKNLKVPCGFSGAKFAVKHTQDEWEAIKGAGKFESETKKFCPKAKMKAKYVPDVYDFVYEYAKDSGKVPSR